MSIDRDRGEVEKDRIEAVVDIGNWARLRTTLPNRDISRRMKKAFTAGKRLWGAEGVTKDTKHQ